MVSMEAGGRLERSEARADGDEERRCGGHGERGELLLVEQGCQAAPCSLVEELRIRCGAGRGAKGERGHRKTQLGLELGRAAQMPPRVGERLDRAAAPHCIGGLS